MAGTTEAVRGALKELGFGASDKEVRAFLRKNRPDVPPTQISLTLRRLRGQMDSDHKEQSSTNAESGQDSLWPE